MQRENENRPAYIQFPLFHLYILRVHIVKSHVIVLNSRFQARPLSGQAFFSFILSRIEESDVINGGVFFLTDVIITCIHIAESSKGLSRVG